MVQGKEQVTITNKDTGNSVELQVLRRLTIGYPDTDTEIVTDLCGNKKSIQEEDALKTVTLEPIIPISKQASFDEFVGSRVEVDSKYVNIIGVMKPKNAELSIKEADGAGIEVMQPDGSVEQEEAFLYGKFKVVQETS